MTSPSDAAGAVPIVLIGPMGAGKTSVGRRVAKALGLPFTAPVDTWLGSRPTLPDYLPAIGRSGRDPRVLYGFGHQHLGLTLGPLTGELVAALACAEAPALDLAPFAAERFG